MRIRLAIPRFQRRTLLWCALLAVLLAPLALYIQHANVGPAVRGLFFGVRIAIAVTLLGVWALMNVAPRKPAAGRVVVGVASFGDWSEDFVAEPRRTLLQLLRPRPTWEQTVTEEGETLLQLPDGGLEVGDMLAHTLRTLLAPVPQIALVRIPFAADERTAILAGAAAGADVVLWGVAQPQVDGRIAIQPCITLTRRIEAPIPQSDLRLCGIESVALPPQQLRVWQARYVGLQQLWSFLLGIVFYAYNAHDEALNELAAVRVSAGTGDGPVVAAAQLLSGNLQVLAEEWAAAEEAYSAILAQPDTADGFGREAGVNLGVVYALRGETVAALDQLSEAVLQPPHLALAHHNLAVLQQRIDRLAEAQTHYERAIQLSPELSVSYRGIAAIFREQGSPNRARQALERAIMAQPDDVEARRDLAAVLIDMGQHARAEEQLEGALRHATDHAETYYLLGLVREHLGNAAGAMEALEQAIALEPSYAEAYAALARLYKQTGAEPVQITPTVRPAAVTADARAHMQLGAAYLQQFRDAEAEREFRAAVAKEPLYAPAHLQLGRVLRRLGRTAEALQALKAALEIDGQQLSTYHELAELRAEQGELERAAQTLEQASRIAPDDAQTAYLLGNIRASQARETGSRATLEQAIAAYHRATTLDAGFAAAHYNLAIAELTDGDVSGAVDALRQTIEINPADGEAHRLLASVYSDLRRSREALELMTRAAELLPGHVATALQLAQLQRQSGHVEDAISTLRTAQKSDPQNPRLFRELGGLYVAAKQYDRAISAFGRARDLAPDQLEATFGLGVAYKSAGRLGDAIRAFTEASRIAPADAPTLTQLAETLYAAGKPDRAVTVLQQALQHTHDQPQLYYTLGQMYGALGQPDRANEAYRMYAESRASKNIEHTGR